MWSRNPMPVFMAMVCVEEDWVAWAIEVCSPSEVVDVEWERPPPSREMASWILVSFVLRSRFATRSRGSVVVAMPKDVIFGGVERARWIQCLLLEA